VKFGSRSPYKEAIEEGVPIVRLEDATAAGGYSATRARPESVAVKVGGNGLGHSDLHAVDDMTASPPHLNIELAMVLGHEVAGWIDALGPGVRGLDVAQPCVITIAGCGRCEFCAQGWNHYAPTGQAAEPQDRRPRGDRAGWTLIV